MGHRFKCVKHASDMQWMHKFLTRRQAPSLAREIDLWVDQWLCIHNGWRAQPRTVNGVRLTGGQRSERKMAQKLTLYVYSCITCGIFVPRMEYNHSTASKGCHWLWKLLCRSVACNCKSSTSTICHVSHFCKGCCTTFKCKIARTRANTHSHPSQ